jgi:hypothetical protein
MSRDEIQKLLGGYATDTLNEAERNALFEAALEDQELFDALAREQALRDVLREPSARRQLIEALGPAREPYLARAWRWFQRPAALAMVGGAAALLIAAGLLLRQPNHPALRQATVADAIESRNAPPVSALEPPAVARQPKRPARLPAGRVVAAPQRAADAARPSQQPSQQVEVDAQGVSAVPEMARTAPAALPAPAAPPPLAVGALPAPAEAEARRRLLQSTQSTSQDFIASSGAPQPALSRAKAAVTGGAVAGAAGPRRSVDYTLLRLDAGGVYQPVPSATVFHTGDSVRIRVVPHEAGYIYLLQPHPGAGFDLVASQSVRKDEPCVLPSTGGLHSDTPARLELLLVRSPVEQLDAGALAAQAPPLSAITIEFR